MSLTTNQRTLKALLTTGIAAHVVRSWPDPDAPGGSYSKTLAEWVAVPNPTLLFNAVNDPSVGVEIHLQAPQTLIPSSAINEAVAEGSEFPATIGAQTLSLLSFVLQHPTFDFSKAGVVESVETLLTPYPDCLAKFRALKYTDNISINDALFGGSLTIEDLSAITNPDLT